MFQNIFKDPVKAKRLFDATKNNSINFFSSKQIESVSDLIQEAEDINSNLFNFIK